MENQPDYPILYSLPGFRYCDLLLTEAELAAWQTVLECGDLSPLFSHAELSPSEARKVRGENTDKAPHSEALRAVAERAGKTLLWAEDYDLGLLTVALDHLTLGRVALHAAILDKVVVLNAQSEVESAVAGLRRAGSQDHIPRGLLTRAWLHFLRDDRDGARADLDEAWEIAERGPMKLFMADIHLYRARLFHAVKPYPWKSPQEDLAAAEKLINECGYHRRDEELADAKQAILGLKQSG